MSYVKVTSFQSFGDGWKVFIQIMDEQLTNWMKITTLYGWNVPIMDEKLNKIKKKVKLGKSGKKNIHGKFGGVLGLGNITKRHKIKMSTQIRFKPIFIPCPPPKTF
jgi:hypothetical protein